MDRLLSYALVAAIILGLVPSTTVWMPSGNEVTVYMVACDGVQAGDACLGTERTGIPFTYKVLVDRQTVSYWAADDTDKSSRFPICAVHDTNNWLCQLEHGDIPQSRFEMVGGKYSEIEACTTDTDHEPFRQVSKWHWWRVRLRETLS